MKSFFTRSWLCGLAVIWSGTVGSSAALAEDNRFIAEIDCAAASTILHEIQITNGVRTETATVSAPVAVIAIPVTHDPKQYVGCLEIQGRNPDVAKMAYFDDLKRCRRRASTGPSLAASAHPDPVLVSGFDAAAFEDCMDSGKRKLEVEIISK